LINHCIFLRYNVSN